jgi:hypothetical protein
MPRVDLRLLQPLAEPLEAIQRHPLLHEPCCRPCAMRPALRHAGALCRTFSASSYPKRLPFISTCVICQTKPNQTAATV